MLNMMNIDQYQKEAARTGNNHIYAIANYGLGLTGEAGEVADIIKKTVFHGHELDLVELEKELGDVLWYLANIATVSGLNLSDIAEKNIEKLKKRYPEGFSQERSINRD
jgi:NTP pyrophosphatase (non-canonical NTP hydrolase)